MKENNANAIFKAIDTSGRGQIDPASIREALTNAGLALEDPRLAALKNNLQRLGNDGTIDRAGFERLIDSCGGLVSRAVRGALVVPNFDGFTAQLKEIFTEVQGETGGEVAQYIPQLARVPADRFAVSVATIDGQQLHLGDAAERFTLQSSCKPFLYCAALEEHGVDKVHQHVGREPSGVSFNELALNKNGLPHNPMINAGAIMTSSLIQRHLPTADRLEHIMQLVGALCGNQRCGLNSAVWHSERETADRNFALAHYMRERGAFPENTEILPTLDYFFSACSIEMQTSYMATMGATFANGGVCPQTGERIFSEQTVKHCLSMMSACGMYDYSGEFAFSVGVPAKSSVSGVVLAVIPNVMGIVVWSPRLDACGNSVRGVSFMKKLIDRFSFHNFDSLTTSSKEDPRANPAVQRTDATYRAIYAASIGDTAELKRIIAHGHSLDVADYDGRTPLHLAAAEGHTRAVEYLINQQVNLLPKDRWGNTPLDDARRHEQEPVRKLLTMRLPNSAGKKRA